MDRLAESPAAAKFEAAMASVGDLVVRACPILPLVGGSLGLH